jgi:GntR family transcriptional regulator
VTEPDHASIDDHIRDRQQQIAADLRALILSGDLSPGSRVPSTDALIKHYNVTNQTVQRAIRILKAEGFVEGQPGRGVFVTGRQPLVIRADHHPLPAAAQQPYPWISEAARRGRTGSTQLISVAEKPAPAQVAAAFGLAIGVPVVARHQLLLLDGEPAEVVWSYYPTEIARGTPLAENRRIKGGSPAALASLGYPLRNAIDQVGARLATVDEFVALKLPEDMPILRQFRVVFSDAQRPVEATVMIKAAQHYEIQYELAAKERAT